VVSAGAQTTSPNDDVIRLSEFNVTAEKSNGYVATNAITATGIGTKIADVPIPINVMTGDFINDFTAQKMTDIINWVPGVITRPDYESEIRIRGFSGLQLYRNGFYRRQNYPTWNVDRIEFIKGAASVFFGVVRPGGVINYITGKPTFDENSSTLKVTTGSGSLIKGESYTNLKLSDDFALRLGLGYSDGGGFRNNEFNHEAYTGLGASWKLSSKSQLTVDLERVYRKFTDLQASGGIAYTNSAYFGNPTVPANQSPRQWVAANFGATAPVFNTWASIYPANDPQGHRYMVLSDPWTELQSRTVDAVYALQITDSLVFTSSANYAYDYFQELRSINGDQEAYADGTVNFRVGNFGNIRDSYNFNNKLTWRFDLAGTKNTLQFGQELFDVIQQTPGWFTGSGNFQDGRYSAFQRRSLATQPPLDGMAAVNANGQTFNMNRRRFDRFQGYYIINQMELDNGKLHLLYGARYNDAQRHVVYSQHVGNAEPRSSAKKTTPELGALYKLTKDVGLFAVYSKTLEVPFGADVTGRPVDPVNNTGYDIGVKTDYFGGRLASTITYYWLQRDHVASTDTAKVIATGLSPWYTYGDTQVSRGAEAELTWTPVNHWQVIAGYSHSFENKTTASTNPLNVGLPLGSLPDNVYTLWTRYQFADGAIKGLALGGGLRHADSVRTLSDPFIVVQNPSFTVFDLMASYPLNWNAHKMTLQLNIKNVFDKWYRDGPSGAWAPPRQIFFSVATKF
jgi:iron complex outermembrane receptor protein